MRKEHNKSNQTISDYLRSKGYQTCEYIESTGTQYIDTGYAPNKGFRIKTRFQAITSWKVTNPHFFGCETVNRPYKCVFARNPWNENTCLDISAYLFEDEEINVIKIPYSTTIIDLDMYNGLTYSGYVDINGTRQQSAVTCATPNINSLTLFAYNIDGSIERYSAVRFYFFQYFVDEMLIRNYYPVYNTSTGAIGLYDLVSNSFFGNAGTGNFLKGSDVEIEELYNEQ